MYRLCADMEGNYGRAMWAANNVAEKAGTMGPMGEPFVIIPWTQMARFNKWKEILALSEPTSSHPYVQATFRYVRGMALAASGDSSGAQKEFDRFSEMRSKVPAEFTWGFTPGSDVLAVMSDILSARIRRSRGERAEEVDLLKRAVENYDKIGYNEPPDFYYPVRESLGFALLRSHRHADAVAVFKDEVKRHPNNGRALFGLWRSLLMNGPMVEADGVEEAIKRAWKGADTPLILDDM